MSKEIHLYKKYEKTELWKVLEKSLKDLIKNQDIELTTREEYVIGYLCEKIDCKKKSSKK